MAAADELHGERPSLFARVRNILVHPQSEWRRIAAEDHAPLIGSYVAPLAVAGAVVSFAANVLYGGSLALNGPLLAKAVHADPAVFSNPFISTFVDATGLIVYFLIAKAILGI